MSFDRTLRQKTRQLPDYPVPPGIRPRLLDQLEIGNEDSRRRLPLIPAVSCGLAVMALAGFSIVSSRQRIADVAASGGVLVANPSIDVDAAIRRANTWHFVGWKLRDGKKVRWEIWGRRSPLLYRETLGDEETNTASGQTICSLPAKYRNEAGGLIFLVGDTESESNHIRQDPHLSFLAGMKFKTFSDGADGFRTFTSVTRSPSPAVVEMRVDETMLKPFQMSIDAETHLPLSMTINESRRDRGVCPIAIAKIDTAYDVPIPADCEQFVRPKDSSLLPLRITQAERPWPVSITPDPIPAFARPAPWIATGMEPRVDGLAVDDDGFIQLRLRGAMGDEFFDPRREHLHLRLSGVGATISDPAERSFIPISYFTDGTLRQADSSRISLLAAEPIPKNPSVPLHLSLNLGLQIARESGSASSTSSDPIPIIELGSFAFRFPIVKGSHVAKIDSRETTAGALVSEDDALNLYFFRAGICDAEYMNIGMVRQMPETPEVRRREERAPYFARRAAHWWQLAAVEYDKLADKARNRGSDIAVQSYERSAKDYRKRASDALKQAVVLDWAGR